MFLTNPTACRRPARRRPACWPGCAPRTPRRGGGWPGCTRRWCTAGAGGGSASRPVAAGCSDARERLARLADAPPVPDGPEVEPAALSALYRRGLALIRGEVAPGTWNAFWQTAVEGRRPADVAADLGLSVN